MYYDWQLTNNTRKWNFGASDFWNNQLDDHFWDNQIVNMNENLGGLFHGENVIGGPKTIDFRGADNTASTHAQAWRNIGYASALLSGINQYKQAGTYDDMAETAETNAVLTREQSRLTGEAGAKNANDTRDKGARMISKARAAYGASGVQAGTGSALDTISGIAYRTERDAQTQLRNTNIKMWALGNEAAQYDAQAKNYRNMASSMRGSSLLNTALQVAKIYYGG